MARKIIFLSLLLCLCIIAFFTLNSQYYTEDSILHIPYIKKNVRPNLYGNDYIFRYTPPQQVITLFYPFSALSSKVLPFDLNIDMRCLYSLYLIFLLSALLLFSFHLTGSFQAGVVVSLILMLNFQIGGTAIHSIEVDFLPRGISLALSILAVFFLLRSYLIFSFIFIIAGFLIHPPTSAFICIFIIFYVLFKKYGSYLLLPILIMFMLLTLLFLFVKPLEISSDWLRILMYRNSYAFLNLWSIKSWFSLVFLLIPGVMYSRYYKGKNKNLTSLFAISFITAGIISYFHLLFVVYIPVSYIIALQLGRVWIYPSIISLFCFAHFFVKYMSLNLKGIGIGVMIIAIIVLNTYRYNDIIDPNWLEVQKWARINSELNCVFMVPFSSKGFRMESERATTGEYKDGTLSFYSKEFAQDWWQRKSDLEHWGKYPDEKIYIMSQKYQADFAVVSDQAVRNFPLVFSNDGYKVYKINDHCSQ